MNLWKFIEIPRKTLLGEWFLELIQSGELEPQDILIRSATPMDLESMMISEELTWPVGQRITKEMMATRLQINPNGTFIAVCDGNVLGIMATNTLSYPWPDHLRTFAERTDGGFIRNHDSMGETICGINIGTIPEAPPNLGTALTQAMMAYWIRQGCPYFQGSPRIAGYRKYREQFLARTGQDISAVEYATLKDQKGRTLDPVLRFNESAGLHTVAVLPDYYDDPESCNYSAVGRADNEFCPYSFEKRYDHFQRKSVPAMVFSYPTGCYWAKSSSGGCTMCGFKHGISLAEKVMAQVGMRENDFVNIFSRACANLRDASMVCIYTGGSFFEIPESVRFSLLRRVELNHQIKTLFIESRPELITDASMESLRRWLVRQDLNVVIAIGLESSNDHVRQDLINKGFSKKTYLEAVARLKKYGLKPATYLFMKPLGLSESEAIVDVVESVKWTAQNGSELSLIQAAFVQADTPLHEALKNGSFSPPTLSSVWAVLDQLREYPIYLGRFNDFPRPIAIPSNCGQCDDQFHKLFESFRISNQPLPTKQPPCECSR